MRRLSLLAAAVALAGCTQGGDEAASDSTKLLAAATARTIAAHSARISGHDTVDSTEGFHVTTDRKVGVLGLDSERGHVTVDGTEVIIAGTVEYMKLFRGMKQPWGRQRLDANDVTTLHHVQFMLYLASGATGAKNVGDATLGGVNVRRISARVDPSRITGELPPWLASNRRFLIRNDYSGRPFDAVFWLDRRGRIRRIDAHLENAPFGKARANVRLLLDLRDFGAAVDVAPPPASQINPG